MENLHISLNVSGLPPNSIHGLHVNSLFFHGFKPFEA